MADTPNTNTSAGMVQADLHKYFKAKKNSHQGIKSKYVTEKFDSNDASTFESKDKITLTSEKNENVNVFESGVLNDSPAVTPEKPTIFKATPERKRKQQQIEDLFNNDSKTPSIVQKNRICENGDREFSAKKKLRLEVDPSEEKSDDLKPQLESSKLSPITVKEKLGKCGHLDELRSRLLNLNNCEEKLKAFRSQCLTKSYSPEKKLKSPLKRLSPSKVRILKQESNLKTSLNHPKLKQFGVIDVEIPLSPTKSPRKVVSLLKTTQPLYAYERFGHLAEPTTEKSQLTLPHRYQIVKEVFRAVDTVVSLLHNRQELITFSKLKPAVQEMLRKAFSENNLGQLKTVFPLAYFFKQEKVVSKEAGTYNAVSYQLTIKPNLEYKSPPSGSLAESIAATCKYRKMDSVVLVERRYFFHAALLQILKKRHQEFLQTLDPPIVLNGPVRRWHPDFPLEGVEPPEPAPLPQPPCNQDPKTAQDVMDTARNLFSVNNRMKTAIESAVAKTQLSANEESSQNVANLQVAAALKGLSLSLLEKIRTREAAKAARVMQRSDKDTRKLEMLSRLPELARILRNMFIVEKKSALPWETALAKISSSHSNMLSIGEVEEHLNLLMEQIPGWCKQQKVRSGIYLKLDKTCQLNDITDRLDQIIKEQ